MIFYEFFARENNERERKNTKKKVFEFGTKYKYVTCLWIFSSQKSRDVEWVGLFWRCSSHPRCWLIGGGGVWWVDTIRIIWCLQFYSSQFNRFLFHYNVLFFFFSNNFGGFSFFLVCACVCAFMITFYVKIIPKAYHEYEINLQKIKWFDLIRFVWLIWLCKKINCDGMINI